VQFGSRNNHVRCKKTSLEMGERVCIEGGGFNISSMGLAHQNVINNNIFVIQQTGINASIKHKVRGQLSTQI